MQVLCTTRQVRCLPPSDAGPLLPAAQMANRASTMLLNRDPHYHTASPAGTLRQSMQWPPAPEGLHSTRASSGHALALPPAAWALQMKDTPSTHVAAQLHQLVVQLAPGPLSCGCRPLQRGHTRDQLAQHLRLVPLPHDSLQRLQLPCSMLDLFAVEVARQLQMMQRGKGERVK